MVQGLTPTVHRGQTMLLLQTVGAQSGLDLRQKKPGGHPRAFSLVPLVRLADVRHEPSETGSAGTRRALGQQHAHIRPATVIISASTCSNLACGCQRQSSEVVQADGGRTPARRATAGHAADRGPIPRARLRAAMIVIDDHVVTRPGKTTAWQHRQFGKRPSCQRRVAESAIATAIRPHILHASETNLGCQRDEAGRRELPG